MDVSITSFGKNKGAGRVWLQGEYLTRAGFTPRTRYEVSRKDNAIVLRTASVGKRSVCMKLKNDKEIPVIDLNNAELLAMFDGLESVRVIYRENEIYIVPQASDLRARERVARAKELMRTGQPLQMGSLAHGAGVMDDALAAGFAQAGVKTKLKFANEIRFDLSDHAASNGGAFDKDTIGLNGKMQELAYDEYVMQKTGQCDFLSAGLPCSGMSVAGRAKRKLVHPEAHPEVGHLVVPFLAMVARFNPLGLLLENVTQYQNSASVELIRTFLSDMGYDVYESVAAGADWNALENRKRFILIAITKGIPFSLADLAMPVKVKRIVSEILENIPLDDPRWKTMQGLKDKEVRDAEAGKSFAMQVFNGTEENICTLTKGLQKNRSTDAKIQHPQNPDLLRIPTPVEHAAAKGIPARLVAGLPEGIAHEALGQSVIYDKLVSYGRLIAQAFKALMTDPEEVPFTLAA